MATEHDAPTAGTKPEDREAQAAPASPPLPSKHTAATPGPRAARLREAYASSLRHTLSKVGWDNFASCYPTVAANAPATLRAVQRQMVERLAELCNVGSIPSFSSARSTVVPTVWLMCLRNCRRNST